MVKGIVIGILIAIIIVEYSLVVACADMEKALERGRKREQCNNDNNTSDTIDSI